LIENDTELKTIPTDMKKHKSLGYFLMFITLGLFTIWGAFSRLDSGAIASGEIIPSDKILTIQHKEGGVIHKIYVKDGQSVKKGDFLIELENITETSELQIGEIDNASLQALVARLEAERDNLSSYNSHSPNADARRLQYQLFVSRKEGLNKDLEILQKRVQQTELEIKGMESEIESLNTILLSAQDTHSMNTELYKGRFIDKRKLLESQNFLADTQGRIGRKKAEIAAANERIAETKFQMIRVENQRKSEVLEQLKIAKDSLAVTKEKIKIVSDKAQRTMIVAPADGKIHGVRFNTIGGIVRAGDELLQIVPQDQKLVVEAKVSPDDIESVHIGLYAFIRISAYKQRTHNAVQGIVTELSPNTFKDPDTGMSYYKAKIEIDKKQLSEVEKMELQSGMLAQVEIVTGERTPFQYMLQPFVDSFHRSFKEE